MRCVLLAALVSLSAAGAERTALDAAAAQVASELGGRKLESPLGLFVESHAPELGRGFATVLAAKLAAAGLPSIPLSASSPAAAEGAAREAGARSLVRLRLELEHGMVRVRGDALGLWRNFWSGRTLTRPKGPALTLEASVTADAHALALAAVAPQGPRPEPSRVLATLLPLPAPIAALAAGDLDGDGRDEIAALTTEEVVVVDGQGQVLARRGLDHLPLSLTPTRDPFGFASIAERVLSVHSASRETGERLLLGEDGLTPAPPPPAPPALEPPPGFGFGAGTSTFQLHPQPPVWTYSARGAETLTVFVGGAAEWTGAGRVELSGLASGSALVDLEGDGRAELATSAPEVQPARERLTLHNRPAQAGGPLAAGALEKRFEQALEPGARVVQLVGANLDGAPGDEVVAGVGLPDGSWELRVLRRAP